MTKIWKHANILLHIGLTTYMSMVTEMQWRIQWLINNYIFLTGESIEKLLSCKKTLFSDLFGVIVSLERSCSQFVLSCPGMTFADTVWKPNSSTERMSQGSNMRSMVIFPVQLLQFMSRRESKGQGIGELKNVNGKAMFSHLDS